MRLANSTLELQGYQFGLWDDALSVAGYQIDAGESGLTMRAHFPLAQIAFERRIELRERRQAQDQFHCAYHRCRGVELTVDRPAADKGADHQRLGAVRVHVIRTVLGVVLDDKDR